MMSCEGKKKTYWIIGLACLAEGLGCGVDFLDHLGEVFVELVEPVLKLLGEFVTMLVLAMSLSED